MNEKVALVTGSSSGIGFATSLTLARNGFHTYATMRNLNKSKELMGIAGKEKLPLRAVRLDVNDDRSVKEAVDKIISEKKRIDVLVNNAGYGLMGCVEDISIDEARSQFETNVFGIIRATQAVLPTMRKQKYGIIVNVSSVGGRIGFPLMAAYVSTKFALEGLSESMAYEFDAFGIKVVIIEPGVIKTNFTSSMVLAKKALDPNSPYAVIMQKVNAGFSKFLENGIFPDEVAKVILKAVTSKDPERRYIVGSDAFMWMETRRKMSDREFERTITDQVMGK